MTYADLATLLLAFFVMLFSISDLDLVKYRQIKDRIVGMFAPSLGESTRDQAAAQLGRLAELPPYRGEVAFRVRGDALMLDFQGTALFEPGSARLSAGARKLLREVVDAAGSLVVNGYRIEVAGHGDGSPGDRGDYPSAWEISAARASAVVRELARLGVPEKHLKAAAYGASQPRAPIRDEKGQPLPKPPGADRRVVIEIRRPF